MQKALSGLPVLDTASLLWRVRDWQSLLTGPGNNRIVVEWCITAGPKCYVYPPARRAAGLDLTAGVVAAGSDERWADFLEFTFVPEVVAALEGAGYHAQAVCADQRPVQIQRERRRELAARARAKAGAAH